MISTIARRHFGGVDRIVLVHVPVQDGANSASII
jgi:hypothetical protein